jgi:DNA-binding response OmpR family regulator
VLIVDDDQTILESTKAILEGAGYAVQTAETSRDAIHKAKSDWFDIALLDIDLPDMQGTELLERLQEIKPGMVKIMVTGSASLENAIQSVNLEAKAYIVKPFNPDDLLQVMEEKLKEQRAAERLDEDKVTDFIEERLQKLETQERSVKGTNLEVEEAGKIVLHNGVPRSPTSTGGAVKAFETPTSTGGAVKAIETPTSTGGAVKAIETKDLVKRFEDVEAMNGTNLEVEARGKIELHNGLPRSPTSTEGAAAKAIEKKR